LKIKRFVAREFVKAKKYCVEPGGAGPAGAGAAGAGAGARPNQQIDDYAPTVPTPTPTPAQCLQLIRSTLEGSVSLRLGYRLSLELADGTGNVEVFMHYCCWPCVCDVQDFVKVDTVTVTTRDDGDVKMHFAVIGDPCEHPEKLKESFVQPFDGRYTTLERDAPELRCGADGRLVGATYSDHGQVVIGGVFRPRANDEQRGTSRAAAEEEEERGGGGGRGGGTPGRVTVDPVSGLTYQGEVGAVQVEISWPSGA
jgi:hypothetical protein